MTRPSVSALFWVVLLGFAAAAQAQAQDAKAAAAQGSDGAKAGQAGAATNQAAAPDTSAIRVRASHRVEVIAPGEHVDTVIDRMRSGASSTASPDTESQSATERLQVRSPDLTRSTDRAQGGQQRSQRGSGPPNGGGPPGGGPQNGSGPPPERR